MKRELAIIGPGRVGTAIGVLARRNGWLVRAVGGRDVERTRLAAARIGPETAALPVADAAARGALVLLTVSDDAIAVVAEELAASGVLGKSQVVAHCSGALSGEVLAAARAAADCALGSAHPLQTFPTVDAALARLPGAYWFFEGEATALECLHELGAAIGLHPVRIASSAKASYHAMAVMACNYLVALMDASLSVGERTGIDRGTAWKALTPLVQATLANIGEHGTDAALTGPIQRGDSDTVRRHLESLAAEPRLESVYRVLGSWTAAMAMRAGALDADAMAPLLRLLADRQPE